MASYHKTIPIKVHQKRRVERGLSLGGVARGGLLLFIGSLIASIVDFIYWFLVSFFGGAKIVGVAGSVFSLSSLVSGIALLGIPTGVARFLGSDFSCNRTKGLNTHFWSSFLFGMILSVMSAVFLWVLAILNINVLGFSETMLILASFLTSLGSWAVVGVLFNSTLKTEYAAISNTVSAMTKLGVGVFLVYLGYGWIGAVVGIIIGSAVLLVLMLLLALKELKRLGGFGIRFSFKALRESLHAGLASWLPGVVTLLGQQLSILTVFGIQGDFEAGTYFIAYAVFSVFYLLPASLMAILFPVLSGLAEGGGALAWKALRFCLALACPTVVFLGFYSEFLLSIMGSQYIPIAPTLSLLASSIIPLTYISAITSLVYAAGHYGKVFGLGLAMSIPRIVLYFYLVPLYSGFGAALAFLAGTLTCLGLAVYVSKKADFHVSLRKIMVSIVAPFTAGFISFLLGLTWYIGGALILLTSVLAYGRLGVVERSDLADMARAFASEKTVAKASERLSWLLRIVYGK